MGRVPSRGSDQFVVRFPPGMRELVREAAEGSGRSMNAEILARLDQTFSAWPVVTVHPAIVERAQRYPDDVRRGFEVALTAQAERMAEQYFPSELASLAELVRAFDAFSITVPDDKRAKIREALQALTNAAIMALPREKQNELAETFQAMSRAEKPND